MQEDMKMDQMTPTEKFEALEKLCKRIDDEFIQMAQLLIQLKAGRLWSMKGYSNLREYLESELGMNVRLANRIIKIYETYVFDLNLSAEEMQEIGLEKLHMAIPLIKSMDLKNAFNLLEQLPGMDISDVAEQIKATRGHAKTLKDVFVEQFYEMWCGYLNCNKKELIFKLGLYMRGRDADDVRLLVKREQRIFEDEIAKAQEGLDSSCGN